MGVGIGVICLPDKARSFAAAAIACASVCGTLLLLPVTVDVVAPRPPAPQPVAEMILCRQSCAPKGWIPSTQSRKST